MLWCLLVFLFWLTLYLLIAAVIAAFILYFFLPLHLVKVLGRVNLSWNGLRQGWISLSGETLSYAERGTPQPGKTSIIFVHGFTASKDSWAQTTKFLPRDVHVIAVDLPGHGLTTYQAKGDDLSVNGFVHYLHQLLRILGLGDASIHVVGESMGGAVAAEYSAIYPQNVACATLVCPAVKTPKPSELMRIIAEEKRMPLIVDTPEGMQAMLDLNLHNKLKIPKQILKGLVELRKPKEAYFNELSKKLGTDVEQSCWNKITAPVQLVWGEGDKIVDLSGIDPLRATLTCPLRVEVLPSCGHAVTLDRPRKLAKLLMEHQGSAKTKTQH